MNFRYHMHTTEIVHNTYTIDIDEYYCDKMTEDFEAWEWAIVKPITPELIRYYVMDASDLGEWEKLPKEEQEFADHIMDYVDDMVWDGDLYTYDSEVEFKDREFEEI